MYIVAKMRRMIVGKRRLAHLKVRMPTLAMGIFL